MNIRNAVRQCLRRFGRAAVVTLHERLDVIDRQNAEIASSHTALLQANIYVVEKLRSQEVQIAQLQQSIDRLSELYEALNNQNDSTGARDALATPDNHHPVI